MPGHYSITTRTDGTTLSASIYNADHQNHVDNLIPTVVDNYSADVATMQVVTDPGEVGSESLATTLAGELERLRYAIKEMKGTAQWYITEASKAVNPAITADYRDSGQGTVAWRHGQSDQVVFMTQVPYDWSSGSIVLTFLRRQVSGVSTAVMSYSIIRFRDGASASVIASSTAINFAPTDTKSHAQTLSVASSGFAAGDYLLWYVNRNGTSGSDTDTGLICLDGAKVTYTGYAAR